MSCGGHLDRCSGHCCKRFFLPLTPEELKAEATREDLRTRIRFNPDEILKIYDMVIPLKAAVYYEFSVDGETRIPPGAPGHYYTCRHHDAETGNCNNYEARPDVCRNFPFYNTNSPCRYKECTWEEAKRPPVQARDLTRLLPRSLESQLSSCTKLVADAKAECPPAAPG